MIAYHLLCSEPALQLVVCCAKICPFSVGSLLQGSYLSSRYVLSGKDKTQQAFSSGTCLKSNQRPVWTCIQALAKSMR